MWLGLTPNLVVADLPRSLAFYRDTLGFELVATQPDTAPFVFAWLRQGPVTVFLNDAAIVRADPKAGTHYKDGPGGIALYITMTGIDAFYALVRDAVSIVDPLETKFYGMREFTITDPDGFVLTFAEEQQGS